METAIILFQMLLIWLFSLLLAFVGGCLYSRIKKPISNKKTHTSENKAINEKEQKEYENFMTYNGRPQNVISD